MVGAPVVGNLRKMRVVADEPVRYTLPVGDASVELNPLIGRVIGIRYSGNIHCLSCGRKTGKSFNQGYCFPCFRALARCDGCIVRPERCHYHLGTCREPEWAQANCLRPHIVYLANSSGVKVGITRESQIPTRWIDQGATQALPIARVASRRMSGLVEMVFKEHVADRTDWRRMLRGDPEPEDLAARRDGLLRRCEAALAGLTDEHDTIGPELIPEAECAAFRYPVIDYPTKVSAINLDKTPVVEGMLIGIKGQYLLLDTGVINVRKYGGYEVALTT